MDVRVRVWVSVLTTGTKCGSGFISMMILFQLLSQSKVVDFCVVMFHRNVKQ